MSGDADKVQPSNPLPLPATPEALDHAFLKKCARIFAPYFPLRIFRSAYLIHLAPPRHAPKTLIFIGPPTENDSPPLFFPLVHDHS